jgi:uncharacterized repeat protein (TIGR03803 family)
MPSLAQEVLWGLTSAAGPKGAGTAFSLKSTGTDFTVEHAFSLDVYSPTGSLLQASDGYLYGMTNSGGPNNGGGIFKLAPDGSGFTILKYFTRSTDGAFPIGSLLEGDDGYLYGQAMFGGPGDEGTIFKLALDGSDFTVIKNNLYTDAGYPRASLIQGSDGYLYGVTVEGPNSSGGTIFKLSTDGADFTLIKTFDPATIPVGGLIEASDGYLYGQATGGTTLSGIIFKLSAEGSDFKVIKNFNRFTDGADPIGSLIQASNGSLYGITSDGGPGGGNGTIFRLALDGSDFRVIKNNLYTDGGFPTGNLIQGSNGSLYGQITSSGRFNDRKGTIFKLSADGTDFTILKDFPPSPDRTSLQGGLIQASDGNLYGVISRGEPQSEGFIFQLSADGLEFSTIKNFYRSTEGAEPIGSLLQAKDGYVYGLTRYGGPTDAGTIFKLSADGSEFSVIKYFDRFGGVTDPLGGLIQASDGYLYGMTRQGQTNSGTIFKLAPDGSGFTILKTFISTDGSYPTGRLLEAKDGYLYGLTSGGGPKFGDAGTIFKLALDGSEFTVIKTFNSYVDGSDPIGSLIQGGDDYLYGATQGGGEFNQMKGNIFKIAPDGADFTILKNFDPSDRLLGGLIEGNDGSLYGTINNIDSLPNNGAIFKLAPDGTGFTILKTFNQSIEGAPPRGSLIQASDGYVYGTTQGGGPNNGGGTIFKLSADGADFRVIKYFASFADGYNPAGGLLLLKPSCIAPTLGDITAPATPTKIHTLVTASAQITSETGLVAKATWHWGDQQSADATLSGTTFSGSHSYQAAGIYTVQLVVEDACGTRVTNEYKSVVIYDPEGGFLTAGAWLHSPAGAYKAKPAASGDAYLLLVAKYKREATSPSGHTFFHFPSGGITFYSTSYEWLVISGAKASYQGEGRLNGKAGYGFLISAIDRKQSTGGRVDKIRIQIWDKNNNNAIVYDTNLTDTDTDADPSTAIHRGAIVIHTKKANARMDHAYIREGESVREIVAYPNPVTTHLYLDLGGIPAASVKTVLSDALGNILLENKHKVAGDALLEIDLSALKPGMYMIRIQSDQGNQTLKVIKQ